MNQDGRQLSVQQEEIELFGSRPSRNAIHMASAYLCESPEIANNRLGGQIDGYAYQRDRHPNADALAAKCRKLHNADEAVVTSSGMSAIGLAFLAHLRSGDHVLLSNRLFGRTPALVQQGLEPFGVTWSLFDVHDLSTLESAPSNTKMIIAETISNPMLHVADIATLAGIAKKSDAILMIDNTFASPIVCRPLEHGADLVTESMTKFMNGHGDVTMGLLCGHKNVWDNIPFCLSNWGMTTSPFDCWLAERGIGTLYVRMVAASQSAMKVASQLSEHPELEHVRYPGLSTHADHTLSTSQFLSSNGATDETPLFGNMLTFSLKGDRKNSWERATRFIESVENIHFCPSLGELATTLSHPASTSHRGLSDDEREALGISNGTIRLSIGLEDPKIIAKSICEAISESQVAMDS